MTRILLAVAGMLAMACAWAQPAPSWDQAKKDVAKLAWEPECGWTLA